MKAKKGSAELSSYAWADVVSKPDTANDSAASLQRVCRHIPLPSTPSLVQFVVVLSGGIRQGVSPDGARRISCHGRLWLCGIISELNLYDRHDLVLYSWLTGGRLSTGAGACSLVSEAARPHEEGASSFPFF